MKILINQRTILFKIDIKNKKSQKHRNIRIIKKVQ